MKLLNLDPGAMRSSAWQPHRSPEKSISARKMDKEKGVDITPAMTTAFQRS
jgi:hypothetical protein